VNEAIKFALGRGELLKNRLLLWDGISSTLEEVSCERSMSCMECGPI
jgi:adenylyltransferase/sulfurtransferase